MVSSLSYWLFLVFSSLIKNPADRADLKMLMVHIFLFMVTLKKRWNILVLYWLTATVTHYMDKSIKAPLLINLFSIPCYITQSHVNDICFHLCCNSLGRGLFCSEMSVHPCNHWRVLSVWHKGVQLGLLLGFMQTSQVLPNSINHFFMNFALWKGALSW